MINPPPPPKAPTPHKVTDVLLSTAKNFSPSFSFNPGRAEGYEPDGQFDTPG